MAHTTGVLYNTDRLSGAEMIEYAQRTEAAGINCLWLPELFGREPFACAGYLLANTERLNVASGIANVYVRDAVAAAAASRTLAEFSGGRFELGLGVSNVGLNQARGHVWQPPVAKMRTYLEGIASAKIAIPGAPRVPVHVAAHAPGLLKLAASHADGATTYLMPPEHTRRARALLGDGPQLTAIFFAALCDDATEARRLGRKAVAYYMGLDYYHRAWQALGYAADEFADGGSNRLIDDLVAWGDASAVQARLNEYVGAGATQVVIIPLNTQKGRFPDWDLLALTAEAAA